MENIRRLKIGQKYTVASFTYAGLPYRSCFTLLSLRCGSFDGHSEAYLLTVKTEKKKVIDIRLNQGKQFIVWEGWVDPNVNCAVSTGMKDFNSGAVQVVKRWRYFDARYMDRAKRSVKEDPLVQNYYPPAIDNGPLFELCTVIS